MARLLFCLMPALLIAAIVAVINPGLGVIAFAAVFGLGFEVTEARPDRGERP